MNTLAETAGRNARALRQEAGVNLAVFARAIRRYGLPWTTGRVSDFEGGRVPPNLETVFVVALALRDVLERDVQLADLFGGPGQVRINDELTVQLRSVHAAVSGKPVARIRLSAKVGLLNDFVETDERVCQRIGVARHVGVAAMERLWGRTFTAERDGRAGPDAKPQHRGQVSRQLQAELKEAINDHGND